MLIRLARPQELATLAKIYVDTFKATHGEVVSERFLLELSYEGAQQRLEDIFKKQEHHPFGYVCDHQGTLLGFAVAGLAGASSPAGYQGELKMLSVLPSFHRMGIGHDLVRAVATQFASNGVTSMFLGVFTDNLPARRFYEALRGRQIDELMYELNGERLMVTLYGWSSVHDLTGSI